MIISNGNVSDTSTLQSMPSYPLRYHSDVAKFLNILDQLLEIYQTESPLFFRQCIENISIDIYDKIIELNGSKTQSKYWSPKYVQCIAMSKKIIAAITYVEKEECREYQQRIINYEHHYGDAPLSDQYIVSMTVPDDFDI